MRSCRVIRDHPRMCGEKAPCSFLSASTVGSPPHVRGKGQGTKQWAAQSRDHPRMCGEKLYTPCIIAPRVGSPPHVRGKVSSVLTGFCGTRITPACAGKSHFVTSFHLNRRDHPRMCGEKHFLVNLLHCLWGSPPHVRGKASK